MDYQYHIFSPYRVCPLGAHVDHQHGLVTGFAIDKGVDLWFNVNGSSQIENGKFLDEPSGKAERKIENEHDVLTNGIWDNWFVQAGLDMSLMNPYGCNFGKVIPKGMTFGLNGAMGKWFTPEYGLKVRVQWDNGLIPNNGLEWVPPRDDPKQNYKRGGLAAVSLDAMLNLTNAFSGYDPERK